MNIDEDCLCCDCKENIINKEDNNEICTDCLSAYLEI